MLTKSRVVAEDGETRGGTQGTDKGKRGVETRGEGGERRDEADPVGQLTTKLEREAVKSGRPEGWLWAPEGGPYSERG